jgi:hypothetical protein
MSTKTTFKRIALVAVAALGFGLISVAPVSAAVTAISGVTFSVTSGQLVVTATHNGIATEADTEVYLQVLSSSDADLAVGLNLNVTVAGLVTVDTPTATTKTWTFATNVSPTAGPYQFRAFLDTVVDGTFVAADDTVRAVGTYTPAASAATEASIKATATSVNISAVSLTTVEPSNRVGVPVIATPAATFKNDTASTATTQDSHKASMVYVLTKPVGSASALSATSATILSGAVIAAAGASAARSGTDITFTPDVAGTYTITAWHESVVDGALSTSEATATRSYVVGANELKMTVSTNGSLVVGADDAGGLLVKIALTGADGKAASLAANESIVVTRTAGTGNIDFVTFDGTFGSYSGSHDPAATATYTFNAAQFNASGVAAFIVNDATASGLSTWTIVGSGGSAAALSHSMTTTASTAITSADAASVVTIENATGTAGDASAASNTTTDVANIAYGKATSLVFKSSAITAGSRVAFTITDTSGNITGIAGAKYRGSVTGATTAATTASATVAMTLTLNASLALASASFAFDTASGATGFVVTAAYPVVTTVTNPDLQIRSVIADTNTVRVLVKDQFKIAFSTASVTPVVTGRNVTLPAQPTLWTNANGYAYYTLKDVSTSTTSLVDTVNFTSAAVQGASGTTAVTSTAATVITYVTTLNVGTVTLTTPNSAEVTAGTALSPIDINAGVTGAEAGVVPVSAKVTDTNGSILTGVKVTWSIVGTSGGAAVTSSTVSGYTDATGVASAQVYGWVAGTATVTATVGGVAKAGGLLFGQNTNTDVRNYTVTAPESGSTTVVLVTAKDRFGNAVKDVAFTAAIVGNGFFGGGTNIASGTTDKNGELRFLILESKSEVKVTVSVGSAASAAALYTQIAAAAGYDIANAVSRTAYAAPTVGTAETDETGVGNVAAYTAAASAAETVIAVPANTTPDATADLAAEALDAANAATDAANAAAEAADAATAAAQDAADAVAALATQVATYISNLRKQITALTNLVVKIQKKVKA